jgi:membrane-associated protein
MVAAPGSRQGGTMDALIGLHPAVLYLLTGAFMVLETSLLVGLVVPGDSVVLLAGTTVTGPTRFAGLVAVSTLGSLLGESVGYLLGRRYGERLRRGRLGRRLGEDAWANAEAFLAGRGGRAVAAARFVAVVPALVPVVAGSVRMRYRRFLGWSVLGAVAWSMTFVGIGALAGASWRQYGERLGLAGLLVLVAVALAAWSLRAARRRRRTRPSRAAMVGRPGPGYALPVGHREGTGDAAADHRCGTRP